MKSTCAIAFRFVFCLIFIILAKCATPASPCVTGCHRCYKVHEEELSFEDANSKCNSLGFNLMNSTSYEELDRLKKKSSPRNYYWVNTRSSYNCDEIDTVSNNNSSFPLKAQVMFPEDEGSCCLTYYPFSAVETKFWWMPCGNSYKFICIKAANPQYFLPSSFAFRPSLQPPLFFLSILLSARIFSGG